MIFVSLLTILSFLFALIELDWTWSLNGHDYLHSVLGLIVIICSFINVYLTHFLKLIMQNEKLFEKFSLYLEFSDLIRKVA
jgi:hypothetical protein